MWEMTEYDRLVYLDADMILCRNTDHLFDLAPGFYAVGDCYGGREFEEERNSCCHFTPQATPQYFNAGFYVMTPSKEEFSNMLQAIAENRILVRFFAEQDFLNGYFAGRWKHLPYTYNAQKRIKYHHPDLWRFSDIHIIHYVDEKPWSHRFSEENLAYKEECDWWWDVFSGKVAPPAPMAEPRPRQRTPAQLLATAASLDRSGSLSAAINNIVTRAPSTGYTSLERAGSLTTAPIATVSAA